jgi:Protein of unknown function (DUF998)
VGSASAHDRPARWTRGLLYCGLAAGPVFVTTFLAEGATRPGYRPSRHPVSSLALGPRGWVQTANFAVTGTLVLAGAAGLGALAGAGFNQSPRLVNLAGLCQRASIVTGLGWLTALSARALTRAVYRPAGRPQYATATADRRCRIYSQQAFQKVFKDLREAVSDRGGGVRSRGEQPPTRASPTTGDDPRCSTCFP